MADTVTTFPIPIVALMLWLALPLTAVGQDTDLVLAGEFAVTIASEDVPPDLIDGASLIGRWQMTFTTDGTYRLGRQDVGALVTGQFATAGDQLTLRGESGVLACNPSEEVEAAATYTWRLTGDRLQLVAVDEPCARRRLLLTTRTLTVFAACPPLTPANAAAAAATPRGATPTPSKRDAVSAILAAQETPTLAIDTVLRQLSDCWATRAPDRFLQLLSQEFRASYQPVGDDEMRHFTLAMGAPIVWERVGDVELIDPARAIVGVRQIAGDDVDTQRYAFVFERGAWRWDGTAASS